MKQMGIKNLVVFVLTAPCLFAETMTLTENLGGGRTFSETRDVGLEWSNSAKEYNFGGQIQMPISAVNYRVALVRFDLAPVQAVGVRAVNSAVLRLFQTDGQACPKVAHQLLQGWEEGTGDGGYTKEFDGANCYVRNVGQVVFPAGLTATSLLGRTVYYFNGVSDLATNAASGVGHHIAQGQNATSFRSYDMAGKKLTKAIDLNTLATNPPVVGSSYYYDAAAGRVYLDTNARVIHWWARSDLWADSVWDGTASNGPGAASLAATAYTDMSNPDPAYGWYEFNVTGAVSNWLVRGEMNYGFRLVHTGTSSPSPAYTTSEGVDGRRPELVITFEPPPPAGLTIMGE